MYSAKRNWVRFIIMCSTQCAGYGALSGMGFGMFWCIQLPFYGMLIGLIGGSCAGLFYGCINGIILVIIAAKIDASFQAIKLKRRLLPVCMIISLILNTAIVTISWYSDYVSGITYYGRNSSVTVFFILIYPFVAFCSWLLSVKIRQWEPFANVETITPIHPPDDPEAWPPAPRQD